MVNIIEDWDVLAEYAGEKLGFYQLLSNDGTIEIRVQTGRIGFKKALQSEEDREAFEELMDVFKSIITGSVKLVWDFSSC